MPKDSASTAATVAKPLSGTAAAIARDIAAAGAYLKENGSLSTRGNGRGAFNAAVPLGDGNFVIGGLSDALVVSPDGTLLEGEPNRGLQEVVEVYAAIFREKPDVNAAIHTHSPHLTAFAIAHRPFPLRYWSVAKRVGVEEIPLAEWAPRYAAGPVVDAVRANPDAPVVLLKNRGLFSWGKDGVVALAKLLHTIDEAAEITLWAEVAGGSRPLPEGAIATFQKTKKG